MVAISNERTFAAASAPEMAPSTLCQISSGSCSTQPGSGKYCGNSQFLRPSVVPSSAMTSAVVPVVPWSSSAEDGSLFAPMARILLATPEGQQVVELRDHNSLGRHPSNTIQLLDKIVSKEHCILERRPNGFTLRDLGSLNGTYINGERVVGEQDLKHGDDIALGATRARYDDGSGRPLPPPPAYGAPAPPP